MCRRKTHAIFNEIKAAEILLACRLHNKKQVFVINIHSSYLQQNGELVLNISSYDK